MQRKQINNKFRPMFLSSIVFILLAVVCCNHDSILFVKYNKIADNLWKINEPSTFKFQVNDTISGYNLFLGLRNTSDYPYNNFYVFVQLTFPNGTNINDTIECPIANSKTGEWFGKGVGDIWDNLILYKYNAIFPQKGTYNVAFIQGMREDLVGISDVGLKVEKVETSGN